MNCRIPTANSRLQQLTRRYSAAARGILALHECCRTLLRGGCDTVIAKRPAGTPLSPWETSHTEPKLGNCLAGSPPFAAAPTNSLVLPIASNMTFAYPPSIPQTPTCKGYGSGTRIWGRSPNRERNRSPVTLSAGTKPAVSPRMSYGVSLTRKTRLTSCLNKSPNPALTKPVTRN